MAADRLLIDVGPGERTEILYSEVRGVDEIDVKTVGQMTIEVRMSDATGHKLACHELLVGELVQRLQRAPRTAPDGTDPAEADHDSSSRRNEGPDASALDAAIDSMRRHPSRRGNRKALESEVAQLRGALAAMGALEQLELRRRIERTRAEITEMRVDAERELEELRRATLDDLAERQRDAEARREAVRREIDRFEEAAATARQTMIDAQAALVEVRHEVMLQEVGVYAYRHPLDDASAYADRLASLRARIRAMAKPDGGAVRATTSWTVNESASQGRRMVNDLSKLMLRAYNAEADRLVLTLRPHGLDVALQRLANSRDSIGRLGRTMHIAISPEYHRLRCEELELTADHLAKFQSERHPEPHPDRDALGRLGAPPGVVPAPRRSA